MDDMREYIKCPICGDKLFIIKACSGNPKEIVDFEERHIYWNCTRFKVKSRSNIKKVKRNIFEWKRNNRK